MLDLSKALYTDLEIELFNTYLYKILTNKEINFKNEPPTTVDIKSYPDSDFYTTTLNYYAPEYQDPFHKIKHKFKLIVTSDKSKIVTLDIEFYSKITDSIICLNLDYLTKTNIKLLLAIYKKWTKIGFENHTYNYNEQE